MAGKGGKRQKQAKRVRKRRGSNREKHEANMADRPELLCIPCLCDYIHEPITPENKARARGDDSPQTMPSRLTGAAAALQTMALRPMREATGAFWEERLRMLRAIAFANRVVKTRAMRQQNY